MSREIKFRAWSNRDKCWCGAFAVHKSGLWRESPNNEWTDLSQQSEIVLMQFTGLLDKNGKEIYEGDIIKMHEEAKIEPNKKVVVEVDYFGERWLRPIDSRFYISNLAEGIYRNDFGTKLKDGLAGKIIGNIYENPDFIK